MQSFPSQSFSSKPRAVARRWPGFGSLQQGAITTVLLCGFAATLCINRSLNAIILGLLVANWALQRNLIARLRQPRKPAYLAVLVAYWVLLLVGTSYSTNQSQAWRDVWGGLPLALLPLVLATGPTLSLPQLKVVLHSFVLGTGLALLYCLGLAYQHYLHSGSTELFLYHRLTDQSLHIHSLYVSLYVLVAIGFQQYLLVQNWKHSSWPAKLLQWLMLLYLLGCLVLLESRAALGGFVLAQGLLSLFYLRRRYGLLRATLIASLSTVAVVVGIGQVPWVRGRYEALWDNNYTLTPVACLPEKAVSGVPFRDLEIRLYLWRFTLHCMPGHWLLGVGTGDTQDCLRQQITQVGMLPHWGTSNAHNQYLQTLLGLGLVGLALLGVALGRGLLISLQEVNYPYLFMLASAVACFTTESMLVRQNGIMFYAFFNALFAFQAWQHSPRKTSPGKAPTQGALPPSPALAQQ